LPHIISVPENALIFCFDSREVEGHISFTYLKHQIQTTKAIFLETSCVWHGKGYINNYFSWHLLCLVVSACSATSCPCHQWESRSYNACTSTLWIHCI